MKKFTLIIGIMLTVNLLSAQWIQQNPDYPATYDLNDLVFFDQSSGWAVGGEEWEYGKALHTDDGGLNWNWNIWLIYWHSFQSISFTDELHGWACGGDRIMHTNDGGMEPYSWESQNINNSDPLYLITFIDTLNGWAYGGEVFWPDLNGELFKTNDGGTNWELLPYSDWRVYDIYFINETVGYMAGGFGGGWFGYTTDGGYTWNNVDISMIAKSLSVIDENNIWIAGESGGVGMIESSDDGGLTWNIKLGDTIQPLNDITFIDSIMGWAVGDSGTILHTYDGGNTWEFQESGTIADLNSVYFVDENNGWICGDSGIILHTGGTVGLFEKVKNSSQLEIFPNPANNVASITFELEQKESITLSIRNISGQEVKQISLGVMDEGQVDIDCSGYSQGIYFISLQTDDGIITKKLIIH